MIYIVTRVLYNFIGIKQFKWFNAKSGNRIAIIGSEQEFERVHQLLKQTRIRANFIGFISNENNGIRNTNYIGHFHQISEAIEIHQINEIIFCAKDISSANIIKHMVTLVTKGVEFKIAPPESLSIIGSNSIDTAGDLYIIDVNNIGRPENRRSKRLLDIGVSVFLLLFSIVFIFFQKNKINFIKNCLLVLFGYHTWVGFGKQNRKDLPSIKPSVLLPMDNSTFLTNQNYDTVYFNYAKDYQINSDFRHIIKNIKYLGN
jgi:FlaA1/EpsC-like NDP-sugar epimerase